MCDYEILPRNLRVVIESIFEVEIVAIYYTYVFLFDISVSDWFITSWLDQQIVTLKCQINGGS